MNIPSCVLQHVTHSVITCRRLQQLELAIKPQQGDLAGLRVSQALRAVADLELLQVRGGEGNPEQGVWGERVL